MQPVIMAMKPATMADGDESASGRSGTFRVWFMEGDPCSGQITKDAKPKRMRARFYDTAIRANASTVAKGSLSRRRPLAGTPRIAASGPARG
ncbi:hypothetical protein ALQ33_102064 [Pseudomonas syringae pv. philadelphi]|uniref:Uncharacterized protein n=1 Tax=Pseudomonas syringae pv. philadelphi TaxID=251706 RepID=A0A3M3ZRX7_9PSED|nr:hypothetical protein ALQ33_102064 [Pseudomonas syringae pv. philadelphi]